MTILVKSNSVISLYFSFFPSLVCLCRKLFLKTLGLTEILDLSHTSDLCIGLTCPEIQTEIWISFSSFIKSNSVLLQEKCSAMALLSGWGLKLFEWPLYIWCLICVPTYTSKHTFIYTLMCVKLFEKYLTVKKAKFSFLALCSIVCQSKEIVCFFLIWTFVCNTLCQGNNPNNTVLPTIHKNNLLYFSFLL